jgi:hypothetical protein
VLRSGALSPAFVEEPERIDDASLCLGAGGMA